MPRLFIFAIGGTGARVLKSLTMLLASGVKPAANIRRYEIVPMVVDPHIDNKDLQRTIQLMQRYQKIKEVLPDDSFFFGTKLHMLDHYLNEQDKMGSGFTFKLGDVSRSRFRDYIDFEKMSIPNKNFSDFLFSGKSINKSGREIGLLDIDMDIGFVGNPNVGSVVLNQFRNSEEFRQFANVFSEDDRVFIISSIFGGTGAAGFPCILKNIRDARNIRGINNRGNLENAKIGALTVLPYFNVKADDNSPIKVSQFIAKTKAALHYYEKNVNPSVNALYYISNRPGRPYNNDPGDNGQQNEAHAIEFFGATAIIDFLEIDDRDLRTVNGRPENPLAKEFGIKENVPEIKFKHMGDKAQKSLALSLSSFMLFRKYLREEMPKSIGNTAWCWDEPEINQLFLESYFYRNNLLEFLNHYDDWINELSMNEPALVPLLPSAQIDAVVNGATPEKRFFHSKTMDYNHFNKRLAKLSNAQSYSTAEAKFIDIFCKASQQLLTDHIPFFKK
jgi:hypothetical protein